MTSTVLKIANESDAWKYIKDALNDRYDNDIVQLDFESWPKFHINIKGQRYNSTITTSLMRSLVELQSHLNKVYAEVIYGKNAKSLTAGERSELEIVFKVEQGSSDIVADLSGFFSELGKHAMEKMTGKQVVAVVLGVAALWAASSAYSSYVDSQEKSLEEKNRHEITLELLKQQPKLLQIQNEQIATHTNILKSVSDANQVTLDKTVFSKEQIDTITNQERQASELARFDGMYKISSLKIKQDSYRIEIIRISDGRSVQTDLYKGHISNDELDKITKAFTTETAIKLNVVGRAKGEIITSAYIVGVNDKESTSAKK